MNNIKNMYILSYTHLQKSKYKKYFSSVTDYKIILSYKNIKIFICIFVMRYYKMNLLAKIKYFIIENLTTLHFKSKIDKNKKLCNEYIKVHKTRFFIDVKNSYIQNDIAMNLFVIDKYNKIIRKSKLS